MASLTVVIFIWLFQCSNGAYDEGCESPQYLGYSKSGVIYCSFPDNVTVVFWYESTNTINDQPIVTLIDSVKGGKGYKSGEFDITSNGSLLINDVDMDHERNFTVATFASLDGEPTLYVVLIVITNKITEGCDSPQYLEYGRTGVIHCHFQTDFYGVFWYNSTETVFDEPILTYSQSVKSGHGFESGEFDVFSNGSLVIHEVRVVHERNYTVARFTSLNEDPTYFAVFVIVMVKSLLGGPVINKCESVNTTCFIELDGSSAVNCTVRMVRPAVSLRWLSRTSYGDYNISSEVDFISDNVTFTSRAVTSDAFAYSPVLNLLVCKAEFVPGVLQRYESLVLVQNKERKKLLSVTPVVKYVPRDSTLELDCTANNISFLVWKRSFPFDNQFQTILFALFIDYHFVTKYQNLFELQKNGSLVLRHVDQQHDGFYGCLYSNGITDGMTKYKVVSYVNPVPAHPVVDGCSQQQNCVLEVHWKGNLTCTLSGFRPEVQLEWKALNKSSSNRISFFDQISDVTKSGETFNITVTSSYSVTSATRLTVECRVTGQGSDIFPVHSTVDLIFVPAEQIDDSSLPAIIYFVVSLVIAVLLLCGTSLTVLYCKKKPRKGLPTVFYTEESISSPFICQPSDDIKVQKTRFINLLKKNYKRLYNAVGPVPFIRDRLLCIDTVFVEGRVEKLSSTGKVTKFNDEYQEHSQSTERGSAWVKLDSYLQIVSDTLEDSTRLIMEGEPGYGKSTITLQMAQDWCNTVQVSYFRRAEIFILLRLRQLRGIKSIYQAIKHFNLPWNSQITENDIEKILSDSRSVMIVLDGYDEYPARDRDSQDFVTKIITGETFEKAQVILTTRSSVLPKQYPQQTQRIRLTGFDQKARVEYIRKAVVGDNEAAAEKIKQCISQNVVLNDLCQAPFFFVIFAHICQESESFPNLNSVTSFFQHMMSRFHLVNRTNIQQCEAIEKHDKLDKEAFEALIGNNQERHWQKEKLLERLGQNFYDQYVRAGILVEEEVPDISDNHSTLNSSNIRKVTAVRFYHNLFREWYAAHYLNKVIAKSKRSFKLLSGLGSAYSYNQIIKGEITNTLTTDIESLLKKIKPFHLKYIYRFACGLSIDSAVMITKYLQDEGYKKSFAILCIMEQFKNVENILENVRSLCSTDIFILNTDTALQETFTLDLLKVASNNKISISKIRLIDSFKKVDISDLSIQLQSNLKLPVLATLRELEIRDKGYTLTEKAVQDILKYVAQCPDIEKLLFRHCLLPRRFSLESLSDLISDRVKVLWNFNNKLYRLNCQSGQWKELHSPPPSDTPSNLDSDMLTASDCDQQIQPGTQTTAKQEEVLHLQLTSTTFRYLSSQLGSEWRHVGRMLGLAESKLHLMDTDDIFTQDRVYRMFIHWKELRGFKATYANLIKALEGAGRKDLAEDVQNLQTLKQSPPEASISSFFSSKVNEQVNQPRGETTGRQKRTFHEDDMERTFQHLARNLCDEWLHVGRWLLLADADLYNIEAHCASRQEAIYRMLNTWKMRKGFGATYDVLINALREAGRLDLTEELQNLEEQQHIVTSSSLVTVNV